jgi:CDP-6-deoxy-D-xylo-4-hexulose-3-dehydrase
LKQSDKIKAVHRLIQEIIQDNAVEFEPGKTIISTGMAIFDELEINAVIDTMLNGWWGLAESGERFEREFASLTCRKHALLTNSGSSANLLALESLKIQRKLTGGDIIVPASAFPTTINPVIQLGFRPVLIDVDETYNPSPELLKSAINKNTVGFMFGHSMGNPARIDEIVEIAENKGIFVVEDCGTTLGSLYDNKICGSFGTISTFSFYPAHGINMGEGGAVVTNDSELANKIRSLRDWGRDCVCRSDQQPLGGQCGIRFECGLNGVNYDHRYVYSSIGYNLKPIELQAAMGLVQLKKLEIFNCIRRRNYMLLRDTFEKFSGRCSIPVVYEKSCPVFFGFPFMLESSEQRSRLAEHLHENRIMSRYYFAGNVMRQPAYKGVDFGIHGALEKTDALFSRCLWVGLHPGIRPEMLDYMAGIFAEFFKG